LCASRVIGNRGGLLEENGWNGGPKLVGGGGDWSRTVRNHDKIGLIKTQGPSNRRIDRKQGD